MTFQQLYIASIKIYNHNVWSDAQYYALFVVLHATVATWAWCEVQLTSFEKWTINTYVAKPSCLSNDAGQYDTTKCPSEEHIIIVWPNNDTSYITLNVSSKSYSLFGNNVKTRNVGNNKDVFNWVLNVLRVSDFMCIS